MTDRPQWAPTEVDLSRPSVARVYDYYLGGSHNFESDRVFAEKALRALPNLPAIVRDNRTFLRRAVRYVCGEGIDQFLDLGSGIPTEGNVHEVAREVNPAVRVVYVDRDPVAVDHSNHLLRHEDRVTAVRADARNAARVLDLAERSGLDLGRPMAVLAVALLHFVGDEDDPEGLMASYLAALPPGSHLAISHASNEGQPEIVDFARVYARKDSPSPVRLRSRREITALFGDLAVIAPGVVPVPRWWVDPSDEAESELADDYPGYAGVGRKR